MTARPAKNKKIDVLFNSTMTSDTGAILLQKVDQKLQLSESINQIIHDPRDQRYTFHQQRDLLEANQGVGFCPAFGGDPGDPLGDQRLLRFIDKAD